MITEGHAERFPGMTVLWRGEVGGELDTLVFDDADFDTRIAALKPHTEFGDNHIRGLGDRLLLAQRCRSYADTYEPDLFMALHWLELAECQAGALTVEEHHAREAARKPARQACSARSVETLRRTGSPYGYRKP
ncbi:hypothetical protein ACWEN6_14010 [Sphaerisporangium sp. NPDC004334]